MAKNLYISWFWRLMVVFWWSVFDHSCGPQESCGIADGCMVRGISFWTPKGWHCDLLPRATCFFVFFAFREFFFLFPRILVIFCNSCYLGVFFSLKFLWPAPKDFLILMSLRGTFGKGELQHRVKGNDKVRQSRQAEGASGRRRGKALLQPRKKTRVS